MRPAQSVRKIMKMHEDFTLLHWRKTGTKIYAQGVGRTRSYLTETRTLAKQIQK